MVPGLSAGLTTITSQKSVLNYGSGKFSCSVAVYIMYLMAFCPHYDGKANFFFSYCNMYERNLGNTDCKAIVHIPKHHFSLVEKCSIQTFFTTFLFKSTLPNWSKVKMLVFLCTGIENCFFESTP